MDSITQIVLGAAVAEITLGKKIGNKAALWGAIAGTIPDLDVVGSYFLNTVDELHFHRGFTHGIVFSLLFAPILAWLISKTHPKEQVSYTQWTVMAFFALVTHPILDCFTTWGTQLFWPFTYRVAFHSIFVIDPLYTLPLMGLLIAAMTKKRTNPQRYRLNLYGLVFSTCVLLLTLMNKYTMTNRFRNSATAQHINVNDIEVRPAPLQNILWSANIATDNGYYIGYKSFLDGKDPLLDNYYYYPSNKRLLQPYLINKDLQRLLFITKGWYTVEKLAENQFLINDLRFGLIDGIEKQGKRFVFAYKMTVKTDNDIRFEKVQYKFSKNSELLTILWNRTCGI